MDLGSGDGDESSGVSSWDCVDARHWEGKKGAKVGEAEGRRGTETGVAKGELLKI